ncbi:MAG: hypothetical protein ABI383_04810 [Acidobacteriaceae bacterium]
MNFVCVAFIIAAMQVAVPIVSKTGNHYLRPDDFPHVPANVRAELNQRHCLIPQDVETKGPHNIVSGEFARKGQKDWAAYCSVNGKSRVVVIWGGSVKCSGEAFGDTEPVPDDTLVVDADPTQWGRMPPPGAFWIISVIPQSKVIARQQRGIALKPMLKSADHDALDSIGIGGANGSYCIKGHWRGLWYSD